jgi:hypothetical protein
VLLSDGDVTWRMMVQRASVVPFRGRPRGYRISIKAVKAPAIAFREEVVIDVTVKASAPVGLPCFERRKQAPYGQEC